ncbi:hypothetical protein RYX36_003601 [Vicia faba]
MQTSLLHELIIQNQFQKQDNRYLLDSASHQSQYPSKHQSKCRVNYNQKKRSKKADSNSEISVRLRTNIFETIKRKLSLGDQILQVGGALITYVSLTILFLDGGFYYVVYVKY